MRLGFLSCMSFLFFLIISGGTLYHVSNAQHHSWSRHLNINGYYDLLGIGL